MSFGVVGEYAKNLIAKKIVIYIYIYIIYMSIKKKPLYAYTETALNGCLGCPV
jgi:hypothetical protein